MNISRILLIFVVVGTILWAISGFVVNMACFIPVHMLEGMETDKEELARQAVDAWAVVSRNVTASWAGAGALMGFIIFFVYMTRPYHQHITPAPMMDCRSPFALTGPKTMAECSTVLIAAAAGGALSILMAVYLLPYFEHPGILVVKSVKVRVIIGFMQGAIVTVCILPFSLKIVEKMARKEMRL